MADDKLTIRVGADTSDAEGDLRRLDKLADGIDADVKVDSSGMEKLTEAAGGLPGPLGDAAAMLTGAGGITAGAVAAAAGLVAVATSTADAATEAAALQAAVGGTTEETSRLLAATKSVGLDYNDLLELVSESNRAIGQNADEAKRLGVNLGGTPIERFQQLVDAVYSIQDPLERSAAASKFFGEEGSKQLPKLIGLYGDLSSAMDAVPDSAVMSEADVQAAKDFQLAMAGLKAEVGALAAELGKLAIPALTGALGAVNMVVDQTADSFGQFLDSGAGLLTLDWDRFVNGSHKAAVSAEELGTALGSQVVDALGAVNGAVDETMGQFRTLNGVIDEHLAKLDEMRTEALSQAEATLELGRSHEDLAAAIAESREEEGVSAEEARKLNDEIMKQGDLTLKAAGASKESAQGADLYQKAILHAATALGTDLNPELITFLNNAGAIPPATMTEIQTAMEMGDWETVARLIAETDAATPTPHIEGDLDATAFAEADRLARNLDNRQVTVKVFADISSASNAIAGLSSRLLGLESRAAQSTAARYVWRNGRYVEV